MIRVTCHNADRVHVIEYESLVTASKLIFEADPDGTFYGLAFAASATAADLCNKQAGFWPTSITYHVDGTLVAYALQVEVGRVGYRSVEVQTRTKGL